MIEVELPDGSVAEFPAGTPPDVIKSALQKRFAPQAPAPKMAQSELEGGGIGGSIMDAGRGFVRGMRDPIDAVAQLVTRGIESAITAPVPDWAQRMGASAAQAKGMTAPLLGDARALATSERKRVEAGNAEAERDFRENWMGGRDPSTAAVGRVLGNIATTLPVTAAMPGLNAATIPGKMAAGAAQGFVGGTFTPTAASDDFWSDKAKQAGLGALFGAGTAGVLGGAQRAFSGSADPAIRELADEGIRPTVGQAYGGLLNNIEQRAQSVPLVGDLVRSGRNRAVEQFNRSTINKALFPIGQKLDDATPIGHEAIAEMATKASNAYKQILPQMTGRADAQFAQQIQAAGQRAVSELPDDMIGQFSRIMENVQKKAGAGQTISGTDSNAIASFLKGKASNFKSSSNPDQRVMGDLLSEVSDAFEDMLARSNPALAPNLAAARSAWAQLVRVQDAAKAAGAKDGVFSPAQFHAAVRNADKSLRKSATARGNAMMQGWAKAGNKLSQTVPDSGTAGRLMQVGTGAAAVMDPVTTAALAGVGAIPYLPGVRNLPGYLAQSPNAAGNAAALITGASTPFLATGAPAALRQMGLLGGY